MENKNSYRSRTRPGLPAKDNHALSKLAIYPLLRYLPHPT